MDVCLMIEGQEGVTWDQWVGLARACEEFNYEGLFRSDHYLSFYRPTERGALDAWATITALGAVTERIRLGSMVSPVTFRHPAMLAKSVVTADHVSGGRVELGMGTGWFEREHLAFGFPFPELGDRMDILSEQVEIVHRLWGGDGDDVTSKGSTTASTHAPPSRERSRIPTRRSSSAGAAARARRRSPPDGPTSTTSSTWTQQVRRNASTVSRPPARRSAEIPAASGGPSCRRRSSEPTR